MLSKSCSYNEMKTVVLNTLTPVRMTHCPPRLQLKTLWTGAIMRWKMTFLRAKCLAKHPNSCQDDPLSSQTPTPDFMYGGHLDRENDTLEGQVLGKSCSYNGDSCSECPNSCQDVPLSSKTPTQEFVNGGHLDRANNTLESQVL